LILCQNNLSKNILNPTKDFQVIKPMKIITWNCNMAFRKKAAVILAHKPDILIVPECEHPDKLIFNAGIFQPTDVLWFGTNQHKGLGIFFLHQLPF
jgi:exonuclease III